MKLGNFNLNEPLDWSDKSVNTLVIENPRYFYSVISEMVAQSMGDDGSFMLSEGLETVSFSRTVDVITDLFSINLNEKRFQNGIYRELSEIATHDTSYQIMELYSRINSEVSELISDFRWDMSFDELNEITPLFKAVNLVVDEESMTLGEKIITYMELSEQFLNKKLFVIVNMKSCMDERTLNSFFKDVNYRGFKLLLIESKDSESTDYEIKTIIDNDLCQL